ncbi:MAG: AbrB/MazE/SpoVT family DNA-binding domain-containing protein [Anaerolineales bacterium]
MKNTFKVKVTRRGSVTLPKELRAQNRINEGDMLTLINLKNSIFVMSLRRSRVDEIANKLAREWQESGETLESMLEALREDRAECDEVQR